MKTRKRSYLITPSMKTRKRSQRENSQTSSSFPDSKRRNCKILPIQNKKNISQKQESKHTKRGRLAVSNNQSEQEDMVNWQLYDQALLELLARVVENADVSMGKKYDYNFYVQFAQRLTEIVGRGITTDQCLKRLRLLRTIFQTYESQPQNLRHESMTAELYRSLLFRCFHVPRKPLRIPKPRLQQPRQRFSGNRRSSSGSSGSCSYSVAGVGTSVHHEILPPVSTHMGGYHQELVHTLNDLHSHHGLSTSRLIALSHFFSGGNNHMLAGILLEKVGPSEQMVFINQLDATGVLNAPTDHA